MSLKDLDKNRLLNGKPTVLVVMGVSGSGKTTIGRLLAAELGWPFQEGDDLHPQVNVDKMHVGQPLSDEDRAPWLENVARWVEGRLDAGENGIVTCSALKRDYREVINRRGQGVLFVYLDGSRETIAAQLGARRGHFMPPTLLDSQFDALEEPDADEPAVRVEIGLRPELAVEQVFAAMGIEHQQPSATPKVT